MNGYRSKLLEQYQDELMKKEGRLADVEEVLPDYDNLVTNERANRERMRLLELRRNLAHDITELKAMIGDIQTTNDDSMPA